MVTPYCAAGRIEGAEEMQYVPESKDALIPEDGRYKKGIKNGK